MGCGCGIQMGGGTRRRKHTRRHRRSGTRKAGSCGRKRACKCPVGLDLGL